MDEELIGDGDIGMLCKFQAYIVMSSIKSLILRTRLKGSHLLPTLVEFASLLQPYNDNEPSCHGVEKMTYCRRKMVLFAMKAPKKINMQTRRGCHQVCRKSCMLCADGANTTHGEIMKQLRTKYWNMGFNERQGYAYIVVGICIMCQKIKGKMHVTTMGVDICKEAQWNIHGIPMSIYMVQKNMCKGTACNTCTWQNWYEKTMDPYSASERK